MRYLCGAVLFCIAFSSASDVGADEVVTLDSLRWKNRVLLLPADEGGEIGTNLLEHHEGIQDRDLVLFGEADGVYRQWFPKPRTQTTLKMTPGLRKRVAGRVTLIGKDGGIKGQWGEQDDLHRTVFALIDSMPMRQREMRARADANRTTLIGTKAKEWVVGPEWANSAPLRLRELRGRVVVVRFWTDTCPYCEASLPALQRLSVELEGKPVTFVGLYQSKPLGSERPWREAVARANELGVTFPIAYDRDWKTLKSWWLQGNRRRATSATFVIAPDGTISHVHPGPVFFPSDEPEDARANADYETLRTAIRNQLRRVSP